MKTTKIFLIFTLLLTNLTSFLDSKVSVNKIKDLVNVLNPEYEYISPIHGAILWESDYVKNFYQFAPDSETKKLVKEIFYLQPDGVTFVVTINPLKIAHYFTPQIIGKIIGLTIEFLLTPQTNPKNLNYAPLQKKLKNLFEPLIFEYKETKTKKQKFVKQNVLEEIYTFYDRIENRFKEQIKKIEGKEITEKEHTDIEKIQNLIKANQNVRNNPNTLITENINLLIKHLIGAIKEEKTDDTIFPQNHNFLILLSALWAISDNKKDFLSYFLTLQNSLEKTIFKVNYNLSNQDNQTKFLESAYTAVDYNSFSNDPTFEDFERGCLLFLGFNTYKANLPPNINYKGEVTYKNLSFPDCGETSLLNFFNAIIYDPETKKFDTAILEKLGASEPLINFYKEHLTVEKMADTPKLHNEWAKVVCGLPNVTYSNQKICDIKGGLEDEGLTNIFTVLQELLPGIKKEKDLNMLEQIAKTLESNEIKLTIHMPQKEDSPQKINISYLKGNNGFTLDWKFLPNHFVLEFPHTTYGYLYQNMIKEKIIKEKMSDYNLIKYFVLSKAFGTIFEINFFDTNKKLILYDLFVQKLDTFAILNTMKIIITLNKIDIKQKKELLLNLYSALPKNDSYAQDSAFDIFNGIMTFKEYEEKLSAESKKIFAQKMIALGKIEYFPIVEKIIQELKPEDKGNVIFIIITGGKSLFFPIAEKVLPELKIYTKANFIQIILQKGSLEEDQTKFQNLYKKIELIFNKSKNEKFLSSAIYQILCLFSWNFWEDKKKYEFDFDIKKTINFKNINPFIYTTIKKSLPKIKTSKYKSDVFDSVININPKLIDTNFLRYLQNWGKNFLSSLNTFEEKFRAFKNIADASIENTDKAFFKLLYVWSAKFIQTLNIKEKTASKIDYLLTMAQHKNKLVTDAIYNWLKKNLKLVANEEDQIKILKIIFDYFGIEEIKEINPQILDFIQKWVDKILPKFKNEKLNKKFEKWQTRIKAAQGAKKEELQEHAESEESEESSETSETESSSYYSSSGEVEEEPLEQSTEHPITTPQLPPPFDMEKYLKEGINETESLQQLNNFIENNKNDIGTYKLQNLIDTKKKALAEKH
jgi:hypothetical protein